MESTRVTEGGQGATAPPLGFLGWFVGTFADLVGTSARCGRNSLPDGLPVIALKRTISLIRTQNFRRATRAVGSQRFLQ